MEDELRRIRIAVRFIAIVVGAFAALAIIGYIILAVNVIHMTSTVSSPPSTCQSIGGSDPTC